MSDDVKQTPAETTDVQTETPAATPAADAMTAKDFKPGQVVSLEDVERMEAIPEPSEEELRNLYETSFAQFKEEEIVTGRILEIGSSYVMVDMGFKSEGLIPVEEFVDIEKYSEGDEVELFLESPEDADGNVLVSRRKVYFLRAWERLMNKHNNDEVIDGRIVRRIKGGFVVDLDGIDAFLPGSQVDVKPIRDFDAFVGRPIPVKIVKVNEMRKNIVVSRRVIIEKELESKRKEILSTLEKGQVRRGVVKNITDFGVFIDLGGVDGLLHITDLSWGRVSHPSQMVDLDQEIDVMILDFDEKKTRISLGLKQLKPHPWENIEERYPVGEKVEGKVVSLTDYGAFVELEHGIEGLVHVSEMSWSHHVKNPSQLLDEGQKIEVMLLNIDPKERKISLGLKQLTPDPWEDIEFKFPVNSRHTGIVRNLTPFGAFVELEEGVDGLVHISDLSWTRKVRHPSEVLKKGQEIEVIVLDINKEDRRIALGHKQVEDNPWDAFEAEYSVGTETTGKIVRLIDKGVIVTLPLGVDAFVPLRELGKKDIKKAADHFKVGDEVPLKVIDFDKVNKRIVLSVSAYLKGKDREIVDGYLNEHQLSTTTLKDLVDEVPELEEAPEAGKGRKGAKKDKDDADGDAGEEKAEAAPAEAAAEKAEAAPAEKAEEKADTAPAEDAAETEDAPKAEEKADAKAEEKADAKAEEKADAKAEEKADAKTEKKADAKAEKKAEADEEKAEAAPAEADDAGAGDDSDGESTDDTDDKK